jgi:hypothetical protein
MTRGNRVTYSGSSNQFNHSLRYASHQLKARIGNVAATAHQKGRIKSATRPMAAKLIQKILRCIVTV